MINNERLRALIKAMINFGMVDSDAEFSRKTTISQGLLSQITRDERPLTLKSIEKITKAFPNVNENFLRGKESNMFLKELNKSEVNEPLPPYGDLKDQLLTAKDKIIKLVEENSYLKTKLQDCEAELERRGFINQ